MAKRSYILKFSAQEVDQILAYVYARDQGDDHGWYYGMKESFEARHRSIIKKLQDAIADPFSEVRDG